MVVLFCDCPNVTKQTCSHRALFAHVTLARGGPGVSKVESPRNNVVSPRLCFFFSFFFSPSKVFPGSTFVSSGLRCPRRARAERRVRPLAYIRADGFKRSRGAAIGAQRQSGREQLLCGNVCGAAGGAASAARIPAAARGFTAARLASLAARITFS